MNGFKNPQYTRTGFSDDPEKRKKEIEDMIKRRDEILEKIKKDKNNNIEEKEQIVSPKISF